MKTKQLCRFIAILFSVAASTSVWSATHLVTNTNDNGPGSLRDAVLAANLSAEEPDTISFNIAGDGPHTIGPLTPLPPITDPVTIDGYSQPGSSVNTLTNGDNAVLQILLLESLVIDTSNSVVRGLALRQVQIGAVPGPKGSNVVEGCFIGLDASGTNSLVSPGSGVFVQTPGNRVGGPQAAARNVISGKGAVGIEIFEVFGSNNVVQGNFIGTDRTGRKAIGNGDRAVAVNMNASRNLIGGGDPGTGNVISGNLDRGITLDGSFNVVYGNLVGLSVTREPLGNARTGIEFGGVGNDIGTIRRGHGNTVAFNGVNAGAQTKNGIDIKPGATLFAILGNSIYENVGLGIDINADGLITPGFPVLTLVTNTSTATLIEGTHMPNASVFLELFSNVAPDPSGHGEGQTLLISTNVSTDAGGKFSLIWGLPLPPGLYLTATANGRTEFSQARAVEVAGGANSWTNSESGKWEAGANWSLGIPPFVGHSLIAITNEGVKTVRTDPITATASPTTLAVSNLVIGAQDGGFNTLLLAHGQSNPPLRVAQDLAINEGGAVVIQDAVLKVDARFSNPVHVDGALTLDGGALIVTNAVQLRVGDVGSGALTVSNGTLKAYYPVVGGRADARGAWHIAGGTNTVLTTFDIGNHLTATGVVTMTGGELITPSCYVGLFGNGTMMVSNGTFRCASQILVASQEGSQGTFIAAGGLSTFGNILVSESLLATGTVLVTGSAQVDVNGPFENRGGTVTIAGGNVRSYSVVLGGEFGGNGTLIMEGGTLNTLYMEVRPGSQFIFNQGKLQTGSSAVSNSLPFTVGDGTHAALYELWGGTNYFGPGLFVAPNASLNGFGTVLGAVTNAGTISPGTSVPSRLDFANSLWLNSGSELRFDLAGYQPGTEFDLLNANGGVTLGGNLAVRLSDDFVRVMTNGASFTPFTAATPFSGGFANVASGDSLTTSDGYGRFTVVYAGETNLQLINLVVVDRDSDGMPDWWEDQFGLSKIDPGDAALDLDGDGATNRDEYRAGTLPNRPSSVFRIVELRRETNDVRITWTTVSGRSYWVQTNALLGAENFSTNFADLSGPIPGAGEGESTANYQHQGTVTNAPANYYRIRVEQ